MQGIIGLIFLIQHQQIQYTAQTYTPGGSVIEIKEISGKIFCHFVSLHKFYVFT